jgi:hypothetical protein
MNDVNIEFEFFGIVNNRSFASYLIGLSLFMRLKQTCQKKVVGKRMA